MSRYVAGQGLTEGYFALLDILQGIQKKYGKRNYCFPSQNTLMRLLKDCHRMIVSKRTLNRWLRRMEDLGLIWRKRRLTRTAFRTTAYYILQWGQKAAAKVRKNIGRAKRLRDLYPSQMPTMANDKHTTKCVYAGGASKTKAAPAFVKTKRCEAPELRKQDLSAPTPDITPGKSAERPESMRQCLREIYERFNASVPFWKRRPVE